MSKVECRLTREVKVMPSMCDENSLMSIPAILDMFQDTAGIHADSVGIGALGMENIGLFWIVSKIRLRIYRRPPVMEDVSASTWIQPAERASCERDFSIASGGEELASLRSIWAALRRDNGRLAHMDTFYPDSDFSVDPPDNESFARIGKDFDNAEPLGKYKVRSVDIDRGGHMNNVNYVRAMLGCFGSEELADMDIKDLELNFISQCYEGEVLTFKRRSADGGAFEVGAVNEEGKTVFAALITRAGCPPPQRK